MTNRLQVIPQEAVQRILAIAEHRNTPDSNYRLLENFYPLAGEFRAIQRDTGHVAPRTSKAPRKAHGQRVPNRRQNDGNGRGLPFQRERCWGTSEHDGNGIEAYQFLRKLVVRLGLTERKPIFDREILTLDIAKVAQPRLQGLNYVGETGGREIAKTHHLCWLLRLSCDRIQRRHRAAEQRNELAPLHELLSQPRTVPTMLRYRAFGGKRGAACEDRPRPVMEWSGRAPAPPASNAGMGATSARSTPCLRNSILRSRWLASISARTLSTLWVSISAARSCCGRNGHGARWKHGSPTCRPA